MTHSDNFRFAAKCPAGAAAGFGLPETRLLAAIPFPRRPQKIGYINKFVVMHPRVKIPRQREAAALIFI